MFTWLEMASRRLWKYAALFFVVVLSVGVWADFGSKADGKLYDLNEENWHLMLKGEWMIEFFAPWCPACKSLAPTWERFAIAANSINVNVAKIDVTTSPSLSGRFFVTALPTIYHVKDGEFRQYRGSRDSDALMFFVKKQQWSKLEPLSAWKKPDTIHMSILSYFFKLSHLLKDFNARLQEEYGLPTWGSYALFAIGTIFVGAALGLFLVCIVDFLYPPKKQQRQSFSEAKERPLTADVEDIANDELADDDGTQDEAGKDDDNDEEKDAEDDEEEDGEDNNDDNEEENDDHDEDDDDASTSEGEKLSMSESEAPESDKIDAKTNVEKKINEALISSSGADVRKRKPRKAD